MRFSTALLAAATWFGVASASPMTARQEALRFGVVSVAPSSVKPDDTFTVSYNSTHARAVPKYLDVYIQGTLSNGFVQPYYQMLRYDWPQDSTFYQFETQLPVLYTSPTNGYETDASYLVWAFITFPNNDPARALVVGGTSASIHVDLD